MPVMLALVKVQPVDGPTATIRGVQAPLNSAIFQKGLFRVDTFVAEHTISVLKQPPKKKRPER
tara:strand:- start:561 stop:749 length:189 start_codon:yes stop_codon:yes gene_type:complete